MPNVISQSKLLIELETQEEIEAFCELISEIKNAYVPPQKVGFQMTPKFNVPDTIGELSIKLYYNLFGVSEEQENDQIQDN